MTIANDAAVRLLGRRIVGADGRTAIRHPAATEWLSRIGSGTIPETVNLIDFPRPGQRWTMRIAALSGDDYIVFLSDRSAIDAADRMRSDFVANASHELRTPLAAILGYVETLQEMNGDTDAATRDRFLAIIEREAKRMQQLVIDLLSVSRVEADRFRFRRRPSTLPPSSVPPRPTRRQRAWRAPPIWSPGSAKRRCRCRATRRSSASLPIISSRTR